MKILDLNGVAENCLGLGRNKILGKKLTDFAQRVPWEELNIEPAKDLDKHDDIWEMTTHGKEKMFVQFTAHMISYRDQPAKFVIAHNVSPLIVDDIKEPVISKRSGVANFPMAEIEWTPELKVIRWSDKAEELFGWSEEEAISSKTLLQDFVYPDDLPLVKKNLEETLKSDDKVLSLINRNIRKDGSVIHCEWHNSLLFNSKGKLVSIYSLVHEVSSRVEAREKLTRSMQSYMDLFNSINDAIYLLNAEGEILEVNEGVMNVFGYNRQEVLGKNYKILSAPGKFDEERLQSLQRNVDKSSVNRKYKGWGKKKNGEVFPTEFSVNPGNYFGQDVTIIVESDVSERLQAEENLRHREVLFSELFKTAPIGIALLNEHKEVEMINEGFESIFGFTEDEVKGLELDKIVVPEEGYSEAQAISHTTKTQKLTSQRKHKDGSIVDVIIYAVPVIVDGKTIAVYGIYVDITDRRAAEEKVRKSLREKEVLLAEIHHRVKNNLAVITGLLELQCYNTKNEEAAAVLRDSQMRIHSIALVHEKLYQSANLSDIQIQEYIPELINVIKKAYGSKASRIKLHHDLEDISLIIIQAIPCGLLLNEILTNCYKHAFEDKESGDVWISFKDEGGKLVFCIRDNGVGIPEQELLGKGQTLGMKLIHTLAKQLNAEISIENDNGAVFKFEFTKSEM